MKTNFLKLTVVLGLIMVGLVLGGCGESRSQFAGTYKSVEPFGKDYVHLDLKEDGKGTWTLAGKTLAEFTWAVNDGKPYFYIKGGGILIVTPSEGGKLLSVDMTGDWHPGCPPGSCLNFRRVQDGG